MKKHDPNYHFIVGKTSEQRMLLSDLALRAKLYVNLPGWLLRPTLKRIQETGTGTIVPATKYDEPVGVAIRNTQNCVMIYVNTNHRRRGIGAALLQHMKLKADDYHLQGVSGYSQFYQSCGFDGNGHYAVPD